MTRVRPASMALISACLITALAILPKAASAASTTQVVSGTSLGTLAIASTAATAFTTGFQAGSTATTTGALIVTDTSPNWSVTVEDTATGAPGHMVAGITGCSGGEAALQNPLSVSVTSPLGGVTSAGAVSISGAPQTVASATNQLLAASIFTTNYSQTIGSGEILRVGCVYSLTATYTLQ
jgi:hypothetical protein